MSVELQPYFFSHTTFAKFDDVQLSNRKNTSSYSVFTKFHKQSGGLAKQAVRAALVVGGGLAVLGMLGLVFLQAQASLFVLICGSVAGALGIYSAAFLYWYYVIGKQLGVPVLMVNSRQVRPGGDIRVRYRQDVLKDMHLMHGAIQLIVRESVAYSCGTDTCYEQHDHVVNLSSVRSGRYVAGQKLDLDGELHVPSDAMPTFVADSNKIGWLIQVDLAFETIDSYSEIFQIEVVA